MILIFYTAFIIGFEMGYSGRLRLRRILEKQVFRTSATVLSELTTSSSSLNVILALN